MCMLTQKMKMRQNLNTSEKEMKHSRIAHFLLNQQFYLQILYGFWSHWREPKLDYLNPQTCGYSYTQFHAFHWIGVALNFPTALSLYFAYKPILLDA